MDCYVPVCDIRIRIDIRSIRNLLGLKLGVIFLLLLGIVVCLGVVV